MVARTFGNIMLLVVIALISYAVLDLLVLVTGIADGVGLTALVLDETRIASFPSSQRIVCGGNHTHLPPLCAAAYHGLEVRLPASQIAINRQGFRGPSREVEKGGKVRILILGDSFTFGLGVEYDESYPAVLERRLNARKQSGEVEVLNLGIPGASTDDEYHTLVRYLDYQPDLVLLQTLSNDVYLCSEFPMAEFLSWRRDARKNASRSDLELEGNAQGIFQQASLLQGSKLLVLPDAFAGEEELLYRYALSLPRAERCACSKKYVDLIQEASLSAGADFLLYNGDSGSGCFTEGSGYSYVLFNLSLGSRRYRLSRSDSHPNRAGHRKMAEELLPVVEDILKERYEEAPS